MDKEKFAWAMGGAVVVSVAIIVGYVGLLALVLARSTPLDEFQRHILDTANGALVGAFSAGVVGFWLGSSTGSMLKNDFMRRDGENRG